MYSNSNVFTDCEVPDCTFSSIRCHWKICESKPGPCASKTCPKQNDSLGILLTSSKNGSNAFKDTDEIQQNTRVALLEPVTYSKGRTFGIPKKTKGKGTSRLGEIISAFHPGKKDTKRHNRTEMEDEIQLHTEDHPSIMRQTASRKGGFNRAEKLTSEERSNIAKLGASKRWKDTKIVKTILTFRQNREIQKQRNAEKKEEKRVKRINEEQKKITKKVERLEDNRQKRPKASGSDLSRIRSEAGKIGGLTRAEALTTEQKSRLGALGGRPRKKALTVAIDNDNANKEIRDQMRTKKKIKTFGALTKKELPDYQSSSMKIPKEVTLLQKSQSRQPHVSHSKSKSTQQWDQNCKEDTSPAPTALFFGEKEKSSDKRRENPDIATLSKHNEVTSKIPNNGNKGDPLTSINNDSRLYPNLQDLNLDSDTDSDILPFEECVLQKRNTNASNVCNNTWYTCNCDIHAPAERTPRQKLMDRAETSHNREYEFDEWRKEKAANVLKEQRKKKSINEKRFEFPAHSTLNILNKRPKKEEPDKGMLLQEMRKLAPCIVYNHIMNRRGSFVEKDELIGAIALSYSGSVYKGLYSGSCKSKQEVKVLFELFTHVLPEYFSVKTIERRTYVIRKGKDYQLDIVKSQIDAHIKDYEQKAKHLPH